MNNNIKLVRLMTFIALYAALAVVLDVVKEFIPFTSIWANGGSIDISLIALVFASIHLGWKVGVITSLLQFVVSFVFGATKLYFAPYNVVLGFLCDYILPIVVMGASTILIKENDSEKTAIIKLEIGIAVCMLIRMLSQVVSGVYCWTDAAEIGSIAAWVASLEYNLGYGIPTMIMLLVVMPILYKAFTPVFKKRGL